MKKFLYTIFISAFAVFFIACAKVDEGAVSFTSETGLAITGSIVNFDDTRLSYSLDGNVLKSSWEVGDRIFGFDNTGATFTFEVESIETNKAKFKIVVPPAKGASTLYAIYYPGKTSFDFEKDGTSLKLPVDVSSQSGKLDGTTPAIMCATGTIEKDAVEFEFKNQMAIVGITQMQLCKTKDTPISEIINITGVTLNNVATTGTIRIDNNVVQLVPDDNQGCISATGLNLSTGENGFVNVPKNSLTPYFAVVPTTNASTEADPISVTATDGEKTYHNLNKIDATSLSAGSYYYLGKKLDKIVAICDGRGYTDLNEAFSYAANADKDVTIKMYDNVTSLSKQIEFANTNENKITLDLNGHNITCSADKAFLAHTSFEVTDKTDNPGTISAGKCAVHLQATTDATLTISGGVFIASNSSSDGTGVVQSTYSSGGKNTLYVTGGQIKCENSDGRAVNANGTSTLSGGEIISSSGLGWRVFESGSTSTIEGAAMISAETPVYRASNTTVTITGGHFNKEVTPAAGYYCYDKGVPQDYPYAVEAVDAIFEYTTKESKTVQTYAKFVDAVAMANDHDGECTIRLVRNFTLQSRQPITNKNGVTLDLDNKTLTLSSGRVGSEGNGKLIIIGTGGQILNQSGTTKANAFSISSGTTILGDGAKINQTGTYIAVMVNGGTFEMKESSEITAGGTALHVNGSSAVAKLTAGTIYGNSESGTIRLTKGEFNMNGGTVTGQKVAMYVTGTETATATITDGYISGNNAIRKDNDQATVSITGGYFNEDVDNSCLTEGYECCKTELEQEYPWQVVNYGENKALVIGASSTTYEMKATINDAVDCANQNGGKIILVSNCQVQGTSAKNISYTNGVTLDLNGKTLTQNGTGRIGVDRGTLTIEDNKTGGMITQDKDKSNNITLSIASGTLNIKGGTISSQNNALSMTGSEEAECFIWGGTIQSSASNAAAININNPNAKVTINGETSFVQKTSSYQTNEKNAVVNLSAGKLTLTSGTIGGNDNDGGNTTALRIGSGEFTMTGGSLLAKYHAIVFNGTTTGKQSTISGGEVMNSTNNYGVICFDSETVKNNLIISETAKIHSAGGPLFSTGQNTDSKPSDVVLSITGGQFNKIPYYVTGEYGVAQTTDHNYPYSVVSGPEAKFKKGNLSTNFKDIDFALNQVSGSCTVQLLSGCTLSESFTLNDVNNELTLNLNGKTLSANSNSLNVSAGTLTIQSSTDGMIEASGTALNVTGGTTKIQGGKISATQNAVNFTGGSMEITGGTIESAQSYPIYVNSTEVSSVTIKGGTIKTLEGNTNYAVYVEAMPNNSSFEINSGDFRSYNGVVYSGANNKVGINIKKAEGAQDEPYFYSHSTSTEQVKLFYRQSTSGADRPNALKVQCGYFGCAANSWIINVSQSDYCGKTPKSITKTINNLTYTTHVE